jgi:O-antigen/teichoic acid export membrane protein
MPLMALSIVPGALLAREMKFRSLAMRTTVGTAFGGCVGVASALLGFGVWSLVAQQLVGAAVGVVCLWSSVRWRPGVQANRAAFADLAPFSGGVLGNNFLWFVSKRVDQTVIGTGLGVAALGAYAIAQRVVSSGADVLAVPAQSVAMPAFSKLQDDPWRLGRAFVRSTSLLCALAFPALLGMVCVGPRLIPAVLGTKWGAAVVPMQILCVGGILRGAQTFVHPTFMALGRVGLYMWIFVLDAAVSAVGCWIGATHGVASVAWAVVMAAAVTGVANFFVISRLVTLSFGDLYAATWPILVACGTMSLAVLGTERVLVGRVDDLIVLVAQAVVGAVSYGAAIAVLARELWDELWNMLNLMRTSKRMA